MGVRDIAVHTWISELSGASFIEEEDAPSSLVLRDGRRISRVRLYGLVVSRELVVDDGTGSIHLECFEGKRFFEIGCPVIVIGRPRMFNQELYILVEVIREIDVSWVSFAKKRWPLPEDVDPLSVVRELDSGDGADYDLVVSRLGKKGEDMVIHLLAVGELFETRPGKLKVLE